MTVDVEDYFQVEAFASTIKREDWDHLPRRVERNTLRLLDIFAEAKVQATFFMLGWVAQRHPALMQRIVTDGHELASHGFGHRRVDSQSSDAFRADVRDAKRTLEDAGGVHVCGYRAPTFSIGRNSTWAHAILAEEGYRYSSSVYPRRHDLYGSPGAPQTAFAPLAGLVEVPLTAVEVRVKAELCRVAFPNKILLEDIRDKDLLIARVEFIQVGIGVLLAHVEPDHVVLPEIVVVVAEDADAEV